jgi:ATP-dependent DNA helicase RecQ
MTDYVTKERCKSQLLLEYFGEIEPPACGKCDICTNRHSDTVTTEEFERYQKRIKTILKAYPQTAKTLVNQFPDHRHTKLLNVLQHLMDYQFIEERNGRLFLK